MNHLGINISASEITISLNPLHKNNYEFDLFTDLWLFLAHVNN